MLKLFLLPCLTLLASPALAGATAWQDLAPGVKARFVSADAIAADGRVRVGLELDMPKTTKTYWRIPGDAGIPPQLDFTGSEGLEEATIDWPYPEIEVDAGYREYVYHGSLVVPVELVATDRVKGVLKVQMTLGVCSDVCIPAQASFVLPIAYAAFDPAQTTRLQIAEAGVPIAWDGSGEPIGAVTATAEGIALSGLDPAIDPASILADLGDPAILFGAPQKSPDGNLFTLKRLGEAGAKGLVGRRVELTFMTRRGPYAVSREIAESP